MSIKKNKSETVYIREIVREEVQKAMKNQRTVNSSHDGYKGFYSKAKKQIISDVMRSQVNSIFKSGLEKSIARHVTKAITNIF